VKLYKLTDENGNTKNNMHWDIGTMHEVSGAPKLCSSTVIHAYTSPLLAVFMNPAYGAFSNPLAFEAEGEVLVSDGTKVGVQKLTIQRSCVELPKVSQTQFVAFGILCALEVCISPSFVSWANKWLSGVDRSKAAAYAAYDAACAAAYDAAADAAVYAASAASAASAAYAAYDAYDAAADAARAAYAAYAAAADAARAVAASAAASIDFQRLAEKALTYE
jgi:hypothetical protein